MQILMPNQQCHGTENINNVTPNSWQKHHCQQYCRLIIKIKKSYSSVHTSSHRLETDTENDNEKPASNQKSLTSPNADALNDADGWATCGL